MGSSNTRMSIQTFESSTARSAGDFFIRYNRGFPSSSLAACRRAPMIIVLSPAKSLDYETPPHVSKHTLPEFVADSAELIDGVAQAVATGNRQPDAYLRSARATQFPALCGLVAERSTRIIRSRPCSRSTAMSTKVSTRNRCTRRISTTRRTMCAYSPDCMDCCGRSICCSRIGWKWVRASPTRAARICMRSGAIGSRQR